MAVQPGKLGLQQAGVVEAVPQVFDHKAVAAEAVGVGIVNIDGLQASPSFRADAGKLQGSAVVADQAGLRNGTVVRSCTWESSPHPPTNSRR